MDLVWWHWVVLGLGLIALEMLAPAFYLIWFGLGAMLTGLVVALLPLGFTGQWVVLGSDRWPVVADQPIAAGTKARVVDVLGQTLKVEQI